MIHNPEVTGSTPVLATKTKTPNTNVLGFFLMDYIYLKLSTSCLLRAEGFF